MNETHDSCNIMEEERGEKKRELETDIDCDQILSVGKSNTIENMRGLPYTVTTVTDSKDGSSNNIQPLVSSVVAGQDVSIETSGSNNVSILNSNDGLKTIDKIYDRDLTGDNNRLNSKIVQKGSLYYCKEHPKFESIS